MASPPGLLDPAHTAVLGMDLQTGVVSIYVKDPNDFLARVARVLDAARASGMRLIHARVGFRPGLPEVGSRNPLLAAIKQSARHQKLFEGATGEIHPAVAPREGEVVITKHRVSAFAGTDLDLILRANDIDTLVLLGIATSGVVLSTALQASDADYRVVIVRDCCADLDEGLHACLLDKLFPRLGTVLSSSELVGAMQYRP
jgi:nicotinamidase-related amidase